MWLSDEEGWPRCVEIVRELVPKRYEIRREREQEAYDLIGCFRLTSTGFGAAIRLLISGSPVRARNGPFTTGVCFNSLLQGNGIPEFRNRFVSNSLAKRALAR